MFEIIWLSWCDWLKEFGLKFWLLKYVLHCLCVIKHSLNECPICLQNVIRVIAVKMLSEFLARIMWPIWNFKPIIRLLRETESTWLICDCFSFQFCLFTWGWYCWKLSQSLKFLNKGRKVSRVTEVVFLRDFISS